MMGDVRKNGYVLPLGMNSMQKFVDAGFVLKEIVIKEQHNCKSADYWDGRKRNFLMLAHEYIFVLEKSITFPYTPAITEFEIESDAIT